MMSEAARKKKKRLTIIMAVMIFIVNMTFITGTEAMECGWASGVIVTWEMLPQSCSYFTLDCF